MEFLSGFESTHIFGCDTDVLETTKHAYLVERDLDLAAASGMRTMRYSVPWHRIERLKGKYDWRWMDRAMAHIRAVGIDPILDPLHHTSFPSWLSAGFANPEFADRYLRFVTAVADRYPWARKYTVINEPFVTTWFCGHEATWYPCFKGDAAFVPMLMNVAEAMVNVSRMLVERDPNVCLVHVDAAEKHRSADVVSTRHAEHHNLLRFVVPDLILGRVDDSHPLYGYLKQNGADDERLEAFRRAPARIDVLGLDYYSHCELEWCRQGRILPNQAPEGLVPTALEYAERYRLPVMLTETNIRGFISDRITWLKFMTEQCEQIETKVKEIGLGFEGFCWYPFVDSTDWCSLVKKARGHIDPQGVYWLSEGTMERNSSELSDLYTALATGQITSADIPAYRFLPPVDHQLAGFMPMMDHWEWKVPTTAKIFAPTRKSRAAAAELAKAA